MVVNEVGIMGDKVIECVMCVLVVCRFCVKVDMVVLIVEFDGLMGR